VCLPRHGHRSRKGGIRKRETVGGPQRGTRQGRPRLPPAWLFVVFVLRPRAASRRGSRPRAERTSRTAHQHRSGEGLAALARPTCRPGGLPGAFRDLRPGRMISGGAWRLDAFSAYPFGAWLPGDARWPDNRNTRGLPPPVLSYWGALPSIFLRLRRIRTELSHDVLNPARVPL
jgi:hypothetical protein